MIEPFAALKARLAARGFAATSPESDVAEEDVFMLHAAFERQRDPATGETRYDDPTDCGGRLVLIQRAGVQWVCACDECGFEVGVPMLKSDPERLTQMLLKRAGLPAHFTARKFEKGDADQEPTVKEFRRWIREFNAQDLAASLPAPGLWGAAGRGKTHVLVLVVETLIRNRGVAVLYRSASTLLDELQAGIDDRSYDARWRQALEVPVLALDDIGAGRMTDWRRERFASLVDYRYGRGLPLLIATNIPPGDAWSGAFGERTASRLGGMVVALRLHGRDRRRDAQTTLEGVA